MYIRSCAPEGVRSSELTGDGCLALDMDPLQDHLLSHLSGPKVHFEVIMEEQEIAKIVNLRIEVT